MCNKKSSFYFFPEIHCYTCSNDQPGVDLETCVNHPETLGSVKCEPEYFGEDPFCFTNRINEFYGPGGKQSKQIYF